jgi:DUF1009 family protein
MTVPASGLASGLAPSGSGPVAILCGGGSIPFSVADAVIARGRDVVLFALRGWADEESVAHYRHHWIAIGQYGRLSRLMAREECRDVVFIGTLLRPPISRIRLDWKTLRVFPTILRAFRGGDDHLLSSIAGIFEADGFRLVGAHDVAPDILVREGNLGALGPSAADQEDIATGFRFLAATSAFDVGQAVVVANGHIVAVEAAEGTDLMLARLDELRSHGRFTNARGRGVLVKAPKKNQDRRFDLPSIGPQTIENVARAGLAGLAVVAGASIVAEPQALVQKADACGVFVHAVRDERPAS